MLRPSGVREIDVAVFGGGPAGAATALALGKRGYSTLIVERSDYADNRIGETLPPAVEPVFRQLGAWVRFLAQKHAPAFGIRSAWGRDEVYVQDFLFSPYGSGWHVDRKRFDALLARHAEDAGACVHRRAEVASCVRECGIWRIEVASAVGRRQFRARFVVDATGRRSAFARKQGARRLILDHLIGVAAFFKPRGTVDSFTLIEAAEGGWWYSAMLPDSRLIVVYMTDADLYARGRRDSRKFWLKQLEKTKHTRARARGSASGVKVFAANSSRLDSVADGNWLAIGDAAMAFDPLSGQGIYKALQSGLRAAEAIDGLALGDYAMEVNRDFDNYRAVRRTYYSKERRWPGSLFWDRRTRRGEGKV